MGVYQAFTGVEVKLFSKMMVFTPILLTLVLMTMSVSEAMPGFIPAPIRGDRGVLVDKMPADNSKKSDSGIAGNNSEIVVHIPTKENKGYGSSLGSPFSLVGEIFKQIGSLL